MLLRLMVIGGALLSAPLLAQRNPGASFHASSAAASNPGTALQGGSGWLVPMAEHPICLTEKRTGRSVCKDRAGWRREADKLDRAETR